MDAIARLALDPPSSGWPVIGQERAVRILRSALKGDKLAHAYLLTGPQHIGKRTVALAFAMTLNCRAAPEPYADGPTAPCGICESCSRMLRGGHPDLHEVSLATQAAATPEAGSRARGGPAKEIKIDAIREIQSVVGLSPYMGRFKVFVVGDAERLNEEASNALLKTLEEPPEHTIIILLASDESELLPTVASRCFAIQLRPARTEEIARALEERWGIDPDVARLAASLSGGRVGKALTLANDRGSMERRRLALQELSVLSAARLNDRVTSAARYAKMFTDERDELYEMLEQWEGWWRDVLAEQGGSGLITNVDQLDALQSASRRHGPSSVLRALRLVQATRRQLRENVNPRLALEALVLGMP